VRAVEPCELLLLRRADLLAAMGADLHVGAQMIELLNLRNCPRRVAGIVAFPRVNPGGDAITVLKNARQGTYYQLSLQGSFLWQRLDGRHTVRDLMLDYLGEFKAFAPHVVADVVGGLMAAGFVESRSLRADVKKAAFRLSPWQRGALLARRLLEWQVAVRNIDQLITRLYHGGGLPVLYTRTGQLVAAGVSLLGILAFILVSTRAQVAFENMPDGKLWLFLIPAYLFAILVHEAGHAFTTKFFGYTVSRAGVGWYWFGPIAFVDTSDMWRAGRWPRIAVSLAGPYANLGSGSLAAIAAWSVSDPVATVVLWQFALASYALALVNLNPLLEYDGYYVLMDWLDRPNLRPRALAWLGAAISKALRGRGDFRGHGLELAYGLGSLLYILLMGVLTAIFYRLLLQDWMARMMSATLAEALAWVLAAAVVGLSIASVAGDLHPAAVRSAA
jgi:putative peptide zinc metalloprotease protein